LHLFTSNEKGEEIEFYDADNEEDEARFIAKAIQKKMDDEGYEFQEFAVLYRTNAQSRAIEEAFLHYGIPYTLIGGVRFYERKEVKDVLSYLRLFINPEDEIALDRIKKLGKRRWTAFKDFYGKHKDTYNDMNTTDLMEHIFLATGYLDQYSVDNEEDYARLENIKELKAVAYSFPVLVTFLEQVSLVESEYSQGEKTGRSREGVRLMTLHQAKGLEFPVVFIAGLEEGVLPHSRSIDDVFQLEEERRLFYVGITRARKNLILTYARRRYMFGKRTEGLKSRFIRTEADEQEYDYF
jgi:DNA helicase-2/ATP-dependent DNA helicase PcrA